MVETEIAAAENRGFGIRQFLRKTTVFGYGSETVTTLLVLQELHTDTAELHDVSAYHFDGAGKYIRPMIVLLAAKACNLHGKISSFGSVDMSCYIVYYCYIYDVAVEYLPYCLC